MIDYQPWTPTNDSTKNWLARINPFFWQLHLERLIFYGSPHQSSNDKVRAYLPIFKKKKTSLIFLTLWPLLHFPFFFQNSNSVDKTLGKRLYLRAYCGTIFRWKPATSDIVITLSHRDIPHILKAETQWSLTLFLPGMRWCLLSLVVQSFILELFIACQRSNACHVIQDWSSSLLSYH